MTAGTLGVTGDDYADQIVARAADRRARLAFHDVVLGLVDPGSLIFDFGAGPGIDADYYAECGFRVRAHDIDPAMCAALSRRCKQHLAAGRVTLYGAEQEPAEAADAVTANFAPLSLVDDLPGLFRKFHALLKPGAPAIVSVLNPYYLGDMRYRWWWTNAARLAIHGAYRLRSGTGYVYRRTPRVMQRAAAPHFSLTSVVRGLPGQRWQRWPLRRLALASSQFMFLVFIRCP